MKIGLDTGNSIFQYHKGMDTKMTPEERFTAWIKYIEAAEEKVAAIVKSVVDKYDPERLLKLGAPSYEYTPECRLIAEGVRSEGMNRMTVQELGTLIAFVWHYKFGSWGSPVDYSAVFYEMAGEIHPHLPNYREDI